MSPRHSSSRLATPVLLLFASPVLAQCNPDWTDTFAGAGLGYAAPTCAAVFDEDGPGPAPAALFVGGFFSRAGGARVNYLARWDGASWSDVGGGVSAPITDLTVFDDDGPGPDPPALVAAGLFLRAGGLSAIRAARWDGASWLPMPGLTPLSGSLLHLAVYRPDPSTAEVLYLGDEGGALFRWGGAAWTLFESLQVTALDTHDPDGAGPLPNLLVVGGNFLGVGSVPAPHLAAWNGSAWSGFGQLSGFPVTIQSFDADASGPLSPVLVVAGPGTRFPSSGGTVSNVAQWNGAVWSSLAGGPGFGPWSLHQFDPDGAGPATPALLAAGPQSSAGGVASWDGAAWTSLVTGESFKLVTGFDPDGPGPLNPNPIVGGEFVQLGGAPLLRIAQLSGGSPQALGPGLEGPSSARVTALTTFDDDGAGPRPAAVYVAGGFAAAGPIRADGIARWDGSAWSALGGPNFNDGLNTLTVFDPDGAGPIPASLIAGGSFSFAGSANIARWDGAAWSTLGAGLSDEVLSLAVFDADGPGPEPAFLYAGGRFTLSGGTAVNHIARWDGSAWQALPGGGTSGNDVAALALFDDDGPGPHLPSLVAAGAFGQIGGVAASRIARFDGATWSPLEAGLSGFNTQVYSMAAFDDDGPGPVPPALYVGGVISTAGSVPANNLARWDGTAWSALSNPSSRRVRALAVFDADGPGPGREALYIGGSAGTAGSQSYTVNRWDGQAMTYFPVTTGEVFALTVLARAPVPSLLAGGTFLGVAGFDSAGIAELRCPGCYPNCDHSTMPPVLNVADFVCFLQRFAAADPYANCDGSAMPPILNVLDFVCFQQRFTAGCP